MYQLVTHAVLVRIYEMSYCFSTVGKSSCNSGSIQRTDVTLTLPQIKLHPRNPPISSTSPSPPHVNSLSHLFCVIPAFVPPPFVPIAHPPPNSPVRPSNLGGTCPLGPDRHEPLNDDQSAGSDASSDDLAGCGASPTRLADSMTRRSWCDELRPAGEDRWLEAHRPTSCDEDRGGPCRAGAGRSGELAVCLCVCGTASLPVNARWKLGIARWELSTCRDGPRGPGAGWRVNDRWFYSPACKVNIFSGIMRKCLTILFEIFSFQLWSFSLSGRLPFRIKVKC